MAVWQHFHIYRSLHNVFLDRNEKRPSVIVRRPGKH